MKNKPHSHRQLNTFRFQGFHQKVRNIRVSAKNYVLKKLNSDNECETLLWQTIHNLKEENLTILFREFQTVLGTEYQTLAQLLLHESEVSDRVKTYLERADSLSLQPILSSLTAFARDTENIFYEKHFYEFLPILTRLISDNTQCHDTIENVFVCFVSLFYVFQKYLKEDFPKMYIKYEFCTLLGKHYPSYVNELAAQSLCPLLRKTFSEDIVGLCLKRITKHEDETDGVGRLLFHSLKADVARRLHSSAPSTLSILLDFVIQEKVEREQAEKAILFCLKQVMLHVTSQADIPDSWQVSWKEDSGPIWSVLFGKAKHMCSKSVLENDSCLIFLLHVIFNITDFKQTTLVTDFSKLFEILSAMTKLNITDEAGNCIGKIIANLLCSERYDESLSSDLHKFLVNYFGASLSSYVIFNFIDVVVTSSVFDKEILPLFLQFVISLNKKNDANTRGDIIDSIFKIINTNVLPIRTMEDMELWSNYGLDFTSVLNDKTITPKSRTPSLLLEAILTDGLASDLSNIDIIIKSCICLPHISPLVYEDFVPYLFWIMNDVFEMIEKEPGPKPVFQENEESPKKRRKKMKAETPSKLNQNINVELKEDPRKLSFLLSVVIETLYHIISPNDFTSTLSDMKLVSILREKVQYRENVHILKGLDIQLSVLAIEDDEIISEKTLADLYPILAPSLASHKPLVRLLVSHIFTLFPYERVSSSLAESQLLNMFSVMFEVEAARFSPLDCKERLRLLSRLDFNNANLSRPASGLYEQAPVLFLIGQLYINFKDIWPPVIKSIAQYAYSLPLNVFWPLWADKLKLASHFALRSLCDKIVEDEDTTSFEDSSLNGYHGDIISHPSFAQLNIKPNYRNFRDLLWKAMQQFPNICERNHKDVVTLFMKFLENELFPVDYTVAPTQDISLHEEGNDLEESDHEEPPEEEDTVDPSQRVRKAPTKSLCEHLILFAKFHNPKVIMKTKELEERYCEFLSHPYAKAQKLALDVIMTYKHKFLVPYKESLYSILDDKSFKNEIALFDIEGTGEDETKSLKEEHRASFMPYLMRILYGKMMYKTGSRTSGKVNIGVRKGIVLRFLAGANESELDTFLNLSFDIFLSQLNGTALDVVMRVEENLDLKKVVPLKRMQGALGTLDSIFDKIGSLLVDKRGFLLKIILFILSTSVTILENRSSVCSHFLPLLKNIRQMAMQMVVMFFTNFEKYRWSNFELEAIFRACIWPSLPKLPDEGIYTPTPLLRLFMCWSSNSAFHVLLSRHHKDDIALTPMPFMIKLINHPKCSPGVVSFIYELIEKLLKVRKGPTVEGDDVEMEEEFEPFEVPLEHILPLDQRAKKLGLLNLTWGEHVVLSCLDELLVNIKDSLSCLKKDDTVKKRELTTVIHIAQWITKEEDAKELLNSVVPLLKKNCVKQNEKVVYLLEICRNLVKIVSNRKKYIDDFIYMFSIMNDRNCRLGVCEVVKALYRDGDEEGVAKWCCELNSYTGEMVDEIDAETRLRCFREVTKYLKETTCLNEQQVLFLIHHNIWVLNQAGNQGLNDLSVSCLQLLLDMLVRFQSESPNVVKKILDNHLLPLLKSGLKSKNEVSRDSMMSILGTAVHKCHKFHRRLRDLYLLADVNDPDADFFLNMNHLQRSRRAKALTRIALALNEGKLNLQADTITEFILPAASVYLFKEEYATDGNLLTSCVTCIGALARQLPWYQYQGLLKYYLNLLSRELSQLKLGVRVLEAVLDAFHEDLSDYEPSKLDIEAVENPEEETEGDDDNDIVESINDNEEDLCTQDPIGKSSKQEKVYWTLTKVFMPRIKKALSQRSVRDTEHKLNKKKYPEDEDIKRIPLALALIKLLKKLPKRVLELHVNNVLMKLIDYLKSRLESIRKEAREMLVKVMKELGGEFLSFMVSDLKNILTRGYQTHVLVYTLHAILAALQGSLKANHVAPCVEDVMEVCIEDLFGDKAEEKAVVQITTKVKEAKADKGYAIMGLIAHAIPVDQIESITSPLKDKLQTHDSKVVNKVAGCLQKIGVGLERNPNISVEHKSLFVYGILKEKINELSKKKIVHTTKTTELKKPLKEDSFLIEPEPRRVGLVPKTDKKTTFHILVEFALSLLSNLMKHNHFVSTDNKHCGLLDVYVGIISNCLLSEYPEVSIQALHVISSLIKFNLPSLKKNISTIFGKMFVILNKFSSSELTKNKLFTLVQLDFKVIALIIKEVRFLKLESDHAKVLISYAEMNLKDFNRYHSSFVILNAFINRKLSYLELHELMPKIQEQSIKSTNLNMLDQARRTFLNYYLNYRKKKQYNMNNFLFYVSNLSYEIPCGRLSAILAVQEMITKDVTTKIDQITEVAVLLTVAERLLKETTKEHRILLKKMLKTLYAKSCRKNVLIEACMKNLKSDLLKSSADNAVAIHMSVECLIPMIDVQNGDQAKSIFKKVLPIIVDLIHPNRYLEGEGTDDGTEAQCLDLALNSLLDLLLLMIEFHFNNKSLNKWAESVEEDLWKNIQHHLLYPNLKVRLTTAVIFGKLFGAYPVAEKAVPVIAANADMVGNLVIDFCQQLITECTVESQILNELGLSIVRNLIYLIGQGRKVAIEIKSDNQDISTDSQSKDSDNKKISFLRKTKRKPEADAFLEGAHRILEMVGIIGYDELRVEGHQTTFRRECFLNLIAGIVVVLGEDLPNAPNIVSFIIHHLSRELSDKSLPDGLLNRTKEVADFMKERIGVQTYNEEVVRSQAKLDRKRTKRKARERERIMINPEIAVKKKVKKHLEKKEAKKRKYVELKLKPNKKRRLKV